jgi:hypothetical protein
VQLFGGDRDSYLDVVDCLYRSCDADACDLDRMQKVMLQTFLTHNILPFADSAAMDSSAELRMPFLDRDLVEFVLRLPAACRVSRWPGRANTKVICAGGQRAEWPRRSSRAESDIFSLVVSLISCVITRRP